MNFQTVLSQIGTQDLRSYNLFETFIISLIQHHLRQNNKTLKTRQRYRVLERGLFQIDAVAPEGIDEIPGPTLLDIRYSFNERAIYSSDRLKSLFTNLGFIASENQFRSVLLIYPIELREESKERIISKAQPWPEGIEIVIWDAKVLSGLVEQHKDYASDLIRNLATLRLKEAIERESEDWANQREQYIEQLQRAYTDNDLTLFLGAGVSIDAGMPDWNSLLDALFVTLLTKKLTTGLDVRDDEIDQIVKRLRHVDDPSPLMAARYLRRGLSDSTMGDLEPFLNTVTEVLYRLIDPKKGGKSALLAELARMSLPRRSGPKVRAVVNYNFDDLLESALNDAAVMHRSIFREGELPTRDELPIYHVHGFLPRKRELYDELDKSTLVFSEEGYHELFLDPYHWSNLVQLNLLRENTCLMIGLSLTDPNLRRLLEIAARRNGPGRHYALMRRIDIDEFMQDNGKQVVKSRKTPVQVFLENHHRINEELFSELGLTIVWFENYSEIPKLLRKLQE